MPVADLAARTARGLGKIEEGGQDNVRLIQENTIVQDAGANEYVVLSRTASMPVDPDDEDCYIVPAGYSTDDEWFEKGGQIAVYVADSGAWTFIVVRGFERAYVVDEDRYVRKLPSGWVDYDATWAGGPRDTVATSITASAVQTQGLQPLTATLNFVSTVASPNDVVTLKAATAGALQVVINEGASTLQVYPASGDSIDTQSANASIKVATGYVLVAHCQDGTVWSTFASRRGKDAEPVYADLYVPDNSLGTPQTVGTSFTKVTQFDTNGTEVNAVPTNSSDQIEVQRSGTYDIRVAISFSGTASARFTLAVAKNGTESNKLRASAQLDAAGGVHSAAISGLETAAAGDLITVSVKADAAGRSFLVWSANLSVRRIS